MRSEEAVNAEIEKLDFVEDMAPDDMTRNVAVFGKAVLRWSLGGGIVLARGKWRRRFTKR